MTPDEHTNQEFFLDVGDGHQIYVQDWGKKDAKTPIIFLHGGPGGGTSNGQKQRFDAAQQRVIFFDQRGSGKSLPTGSIENNTTAHLIEDIETLTQHLNIKEFIITGGSWGSCLGLAYTLKHPKKVKALVLSGIYTASSTETAYIDNGGFSEFFPDIWQTYIDSVPKEFAGDPSAYHYKQAFGSDPEAAKRSIYAYAELEGSLLSLDDRHTPQDYATFDPLSMKIELHYLKNNGFLPENYILDNAHKIQTETWLVLLEQKKQGFYSRYLMLWYVDDDWLFT